MFIEKYYDKQCFLFYNYCNFILFLKKVRKENENNVIMFLSRDSYFLYLLYANMYPELKLGKDYVYIFSSRHCFCGRRNDYYKKYIESFNSEKKNILMIDIYGTGNTFLRFINYYNLYNIKILFYCHNNTELGYLEHRNKEDVDGFIFSRDGIFLESIFRAPHDKVIGVTNDYSPILSIENAHDKTDIVNDKDKKLLLGLYDEIIKNMPYHKNIRYYTLGLKNFTNINNPKKEINGMVVFDIDNTITNVEDYEYVKQIVKICNNCNIKIILVTARQQPYKHGELYNMKISTINDILDKISFDYNLNIIDVWYNPFCFKVNNVDEVKHETIKKNMEIFNIKNENLLFFDDSFENIIYCIQKGIQSKMVNVGKGIDKECLELFKLIFKEQITSQVGSE